MVRLRIMYTNGIEIFQVFRDYSKATEYIALEGDHVLDWDWEYV